MTNYYRISADQTQDPIRSGQYTRQCKIRLGEGYYYITQPKNLRTFFHTMTKTLLPQRHLHPSFLKIKLVFVELTYRGGGAHTARSTA